MEPILKGDWNGLGLGHNFEPEKATGFGGIFLVIGRTIQRAINAAGYPRRNFNHSFWLGWVWKYVRARGSLHSAWHRRKFDCRMSMVVKKGATMAAMWRPFRFEPFPLGRRGLFRTARSGQGRAVVGRGEANP